MDIINVFTKLLGKSRNEKAIPNGYCPTCWGREEYGGKFYKAVYTEGVNLNNIKEKKGWITAYIEKNLEGIKLKKIEGIRECSTCNTSYKEI